MEEAQDPRALETIVDADYISCATSMWLMEENWDNTLRFEQKRVRSDASSHSCWPEKFEALGGKVDVGGPAIDSRSTVEGRLFVEEVGIAMNDWDRRRQHLLSC